MAKYRIGHSAKEDLIRIYHYGVQNFGLTQAEIYFNTFLEYFDIIAERPYAFESVDFIRPGYRRCVCGADSIFYQVQNDIVEIMAIIGRKDISKILSQ